VDALYGVVVKLAADVAADPVNFDVLAQYGLLGFVAAGAIIFGRVSYRREIDRADRMEAEVTRLNGVIIERDNMIIDRAIPALTSAAQAVAEATRLLRELQHLNELHLMHGPDTRRQHPGGEDR
jgi:hypothetical protein